MKHYLVNSQNTLINLLDYLERERIPEDLAIEKIQNIQRMELHGKTTIILEEYDINPRHRPPIYY